MFLSQEGKGKERGEEGKGKERRGGEGSFKTTYAQIKEKQQPYTLFIINQTYFLTWH